MFGDPQNVVLRLREKYGLKYKRALRVIFRPKNEDLRGGWRSFQNLEFPDFYSSPNVIWASYGNSRRQETACKIEA
jgi:hypothetical protein